MQHHVYTAWVWCQRARPRVHPRNHDGVTHRCSRTNTRRDVLMPRHVLGTAYIMPLRWRPPHRVAVCTCVLLGGACRVRGTPARSQSGCHPKHWAVRQVQQGVLRVRDGAINVAEQ